MTDMSTGRLREMLDEATPGPWRADDTTGEIYDTNGKQVAYPLEEYGDEIWIEWATDADHILAAGAPELAEEVIRLREDLRHYLDDLNAGLILCESDTPLTASQVESIAYDLTRILEGDKP